MPCPKNKEAVFTTIKQTLLPLGFQIIQENDTTLKLKSSSLLWARGQNPLMGISDIVAYVKDQNLHVKANLGGLKNTIWFLLFVILLMAVTVSSRPSASCEVL